jgi:hypothetical protein
MNSVGTSFYTVINMFYHEDRKHLSIIMIAFSLCYIKYTRNIELKRKLRILMTSVLCVM